MLPVVAAVAAFGLTGDARAFASEVSRQQNTHESRTPLRTPEDVFARMRDGFRKEEAKGVHARYQFDISGPNGGHWWIIVDNGSFAMDRGTIENADVTISARDRDWVRLSEDELNGTFAFLTGRLRIAGNKSLAQTLGVVFP